MFPEQSVLDIMNHWKLLTCRAGRYEVDGYVYNAEEEPKMLMTGKWNETMSYQPCDLEGEPLPGTELKEVLLYHPCISIYASHAGLEYYVVQKSCWMTVRICTLTCLSLRCIHLCTILFRMDY